SLSFTAARRSWLLVFAFKRKCEETGTRRERWTPGRVGQSMNPDGPTHAHLLNEHQCSELSNAAQLTGAPRQDDAPSCDLVKAARFESRANELERLFKSRLDDADQNRSGDLIRDAGFFFTDLRHVDDLALIRRCCDAVAVERLDALRMRERRRQAARDVVGDVAAADGNG